MAIDSSGGGAGSISLLRDSIASLRGLDNINRINPTPDDPDRRAPPPEDTVRLSESSTTDPRAVEQQQLDAVRQGLSDASAAGNVALAGAQSVSDTLGEIGSRLQQLTDDSLSRDRRDVLADEIRQLARQGLETVERSSFNGVNLLDDRRDEDLVVAADREGATETVRDQNLRPALESLQELNLDSAAGAQAALETTFADARTAADAAVEQLAEDTGRVGERIAEIQDRQSELAGTDEGVDTGLTAGTAQESAQQLIAQLQQTLGDQSSLSIANVRPETLVGLFR